MENVRNRKNKNDSKLARKYVEVIKDSSNNELEKTCDKEDFNDDYSGRNSPNITEPTAEKVDVKWKEKPKLFRINCEIDVLSLVLFLFGILTRMYNLEEPKNIVFDELHYGKYVSLYMKNTFFFDSHPPLGKQLIAVMAYLAGYDGKFKFDKIGSPYTSTMPLLALRFVPAFFGSLIVPTVYHLMLEMGLSQWSSLLAALLFLFDNAFLTQSRFILMESMLIFFSLFGLLALLKFRKYTERPYSVFWFFWIVISCFSLTCALSIKYVGFYTCCLGAIIVLQDFWRLLSSNKLSDQSLCLRFLIQSITALFIAGLVYISVFYVHLNTLYKAGPHDSIMTSAFQASLEGGLASITKGQPLLVAHGSQITLRHSHGRTCWLHSHNAVYPIRYPDKRGSSHQQQVTCYSFKDVNNWWIVKRPEKNDLIVEQPVDAIKHGDVIQLVHGISSRALNSHDVAAPMSPQCQEVSCYIDYNISMPAQNLWKVEVVNKEQNGDAWHTIQSLVRLIHVDSNTALKYTGRQLPDWGFHQHEVAADRVIIQDDTVWNVEEHRYTKSGDQKEREREMVTAEMIPTTPTRLSFWQKFFELHYKMMFANTENVQNHMYSSEPHEWPFLSRGIAYWISSTSNAQVHLLGNIAIWYSATFGLFTYFSLLVIYLLRRRRQCYDLHPHIWTQFQKTGEIFFTGYLFHYLPYFFVDRTLFLHNYLPAYAFKTLLLVATIEHVYVVLHDVFRVKFLKMLFLVVLVIWLGWVVYVFKKFSVLSYGTTDLTTEDILKLRWKDTWDFIVHKN
ncbi:protein O-mannosyltransferase 1 [Diabrotica undecimpunctata]|uniref:protein O-mannosyltransferase 1 n=1 Tax=Diabrotica undecimpunctata TaxID=50387 RepID=UPI003B639ED6